MSLIQIVLQQGAGGCITFKIGTVGHDHSFMPLADSFCAPGDNKLKQYCLRATSKFQSGCSTRHPHLKIDDLRRELKVSKSQSTASGVTVLKLCPSSAT